ncbi:adenylate/guanylate cyclase domain-containing protein [Oscillatoria sp. FACHB-1406]|uniref:adenylate/guanylate cyclase domain-containing protein n=1 Tax=Oscillatoria sp. FACHB-1406 TaxID=2692846 RepID=UPI0016833B53|nr:adenylate/guanylate cyclase domain-containing protein [Oscillatoria sp. FACHB-1406]MBD2578783.1 FHA domain-containing protein [Oscillatoria sp. FACHB-1406]
MTELQLRIHIEGQAESTVKVAKDEFIIGRLPECDLCLPYSEISRHHTRVWSDKEKRWHVEDLGSTNGTLLNQQPLRAPQRLYPNDFLQIGNAILIVNLPQNTHVSLGQRPLSNDGQTILRSAEELREEWIEAAQSGDAYSDSQQAISRLKYLVEIAKNLNSAESIEAIFAQVQAVVFQELPSIQRLALLVDVKGDGHLRAIEVAARHALPEGKSTYTNGWIGRTICEKVFNEKVAIKTVDAQSDARFEGENSIVAKGIRGAFAVPLWDANQVVGVLYADGNVTLTGSGSADDEELSFFSTLANLVAYSIQRWRLTEKLKDEARIRHQLERYHSPSVVQHLMAAGALERGCLEPLEADISILFADLVGFTALSEQLSPGEISQLLNRFFEEMLKFVFGTGGTLDKFIGDCIMAFFGAPEPQRDHADRAVAAAMGMLEHLDRLNAQQIWPQPLQLRIAINSGRAVAGDVGSAQRVDYTVLGATVNLAARMESVCAPGECIISEATYRNLRKRDRFVLIGQKQFKGIDRSVMIYQTQRRKK